MRLLRSVRARLTGWYSAILALVLIVFGALLYGVVRYQSLHHHDDSLESAAGTVMSILGRQPDCATLTPDQLEDLAHLDRLVLVHDLAGQGQVFYHSPDFDPALLPRNQEEFRQLLSQSESFQTLEGPTGALRIYSVRYTTHTGRQGVVRVMDSLGNVRESLATLQWALVLMIPLCLLVAGVGGYWLAGRALRPVDEVTRLAREISATNLRLRLPAPRTDDELGRLVNTFNQMIGRLEGSFESMRRFTADASHELRTPLAIMRSAIDVALGRERAVEEYRRTLADLVENVERMNRILDHLLLLARADAGSLEMRREPVSLDGLVLEVVDAMRPLADAHRINLSADASGPVQVDGDERWLRQMLYNLVDNAIKYTRENGKVTVSLESRNGLALVSVRDTGIGIPEEQQPHLFERFYRVDKARSRENGGAGLGLSIALWIARSHGGDIQVESLAEHGSTFRIRIPLHRDPHVPGAADSSSPLATP